MTLTTTIEGHLEFHSETGTEGGYWAFFDPRFEHGPEVDCGAPDCPLKMHEILDEHGNGTDRYGASGTGERVFGDRHASYDGLITLQDGDRLEIRHLETGDVVYVGPVKLQQQDPYGDHSRDLCGLAIHSVPELPPSITLEEWGDWFLQRWPATLTTSRELTALDGIRW